MIAPDTLLQNRYLVQKQVGKGGMGLVYMATDQRFGSTVALKEIYLEAPHLRKAFEREARLLNHLRHAALPRVSDHFTEDDGQFLVMEFIPGADLSEMLKGKKVPFPVATVLEWADQLLDALEYLHTHEPPIIHRDIKPQNLKLTSRGHIVLLDFGLAKGTPAHAATATANASVFGYSFNYAPLEQMQGAGTDPRSDLYSLGATLYHLLTNVTPPDALTRATAVLNGEPDPLRPADKVQAQVSGPVARVLESAMAQSAAKRPQTAAEMRQALREASKQSNVIAPSPVVQPIVGIGAVAEQKSQAGGARVTKPLTSYHSNSNPSLPHDAPTVVQPAFLPGDSQPSTIRIRERESVTTKTRASQPPAPERRASGRMISIITSVVLLAVVAAAVYAFTRQPATTTPSAQTLPPTVDTLAPSTNAARETQASGTSPGLSNAPASSRQPVNSPSNSPQDNPAAHSSTSQAEAPFSNAPAVQTSSLGAPSQPESNPSSALTPEAERAQKADEIRRERRLREEEDLRRQRELADRERAREFELQREREMRRREGPPPPGGRFPPPRRGGPPPF